MKIKFCGAAGTVTGSCFHVTVGKTSFLVDCGMFQGSKTLREGNYRAFPFAPDQVDFVVLTHAHIDHSGLLPKLVKHGFTGAIYSTPPTASLCKYMLPDSAHIQEMEVEQKNKRNERRGGPELEPIYTIADAEKTIGLFKPVKLHERTQLGEGVVLTFRNAGHIFGSAFAEIELTEGTEKRKIVFSGDLGSVGHPIIEDPENFTTTDFLVIESTYGSRVRPPEDAVARRAKLAEAINTTCSRGGNLVIPGFAVGRTQDMLHDVLLLIREGKLTNPEVYIDSPLAVQVTQVFSEFRECFDREARELLGNRDKLFDHPAFHFSTTAADSRAINGKRGCVIISASGMCDAGRIKHHLKHNLYRPENCVLMVGYQAEGTLGQLLLSGAKTVRIFGEEVTVKAKIDAIAGYSGHADQKSLLEWLAPVQAINREVFVVHGEPESSAALARLIAEKKSVATHAPTWGEEVDLLGLPSARPKPAVAVAPVPAYDSHNRYAQLMIDLAAFMQGERNEAKRLEKLAAISAVLKK